MTAATSTKTPYERLLAESQKTGLPSSYKTDLTDIDRKTLKDYGIESFVWIVREQGTHLYWDKQQYKSLIETFNVFGNEIRYVYTYKDGRLSKSLFKSHALDFLYGLEHGKTYKHDFIKAFQETADKIAGIIARGEKCLLEDLYFYWDCEYIPFKGMEYDKEDCYKVKFIGYDISVEWRYEVRLFHRNTIEI